MTGDGNWKESKIVLRVFVLVTCIKLLLVPTYHSTDFEVHRNWLAITHNLPIRQWYVNARSQWTLDYPPLFAWFEWLLSQAAVLFDPEMLRVENLDYASPRTVLFQRATVMLADLMLAYGVKEVGKVFCTSYSSYAAFVLLSLCNMGLLVVDHVHFQYNGFLFGMLLLSIARVSRIKEQVSVLEGAFWFAALLNFKHIYLYVAPAFGVWLLRAYCIEGGGFLKRVFTLGCVVLTTFAVSLGPFAFQWRQVLSRLFPFKRGLVHAYWAANSWTLYIGLDKALSLIWKRLGWMEGTRSALMTGGLVQEQSLALLPTPTPFATFLLTFLSICPAIGHLLFQRTCRADRRQFLRCAVLCALGAFMFGWHVHEKAILTAIIPLCVLAVSNPEDARVFVILSSAGHTGVLPLLHPTDLAPLKLLLLLTYTLLTVFILSKRFEKPLLASHESVYVWLLPFLVVYETVLHRLIFGVFLPFLPLALISVYCAIGVSYSWLSYYHLFLFCPHDNVVQTEEERTERA